MAWKMDRFWNEKIFNDACGQCQREYTVILQLLSLGPGIFKQDLHSIAWNEVRMQTKSWHETLAAYLILCKKKDCTAKEDLSSE